MWSLAIRDFETCLAQKTVVAAEVGVALTFHIGIIVELHEENVERSTLEVSFERNITRYEISSKSSSSKRIFEESSFRRTFEDS